MSISRITRRTALAVLVFVVAGGLASATARATSGTLYLTSNTSLKEDHYGSIIVNADNVTLDCAGHAVLGPGSTGILVSARSYVTVRNCRVSGFGAGIVLWQSTSSTVAGNTVSDSSGWGAGGFWGVGIGGYGVVDGAFFDNVSDANGGFGLSLFYSSGTTLSQNRATNNASIGFWISDSTGNTLTGNTASGNSGEGFEIPNGSSSNLLVANTSTGNGSDGFQVLGYSTGNRLLNNVASDNGGDGFSSYGAKGNVYVGNRASGSHKGFALLYGSAQNSLTGNAAFANETGFFVMRGSTGNALNLNIGQGNTTFDAWDGNPPGANTWKANTFGTSSPPGLGFGRFN